jgi:bifunctional non-homologous end joining protein LigD
MKAARMMNGESTAQLPLIERTERLQRLFKKEVGGLRYSEHVIWQRPPASARKPASWA